MKQNFFLAVLCSLFANLNFSIINVIISKMPYEIHAMRIFFFQMAFSCIILLPWIFRNGFGVIKTKQLKLHAMRGVISIISVFFFYTSLRMLSSVDAVLVKNTAPFYVPLLAMLWLRERVLPITWPLIAIGFVGVYLVIGPFDTGFSFVHFFPLLAAVGYAYMVVSVSRLRIRDTPEQILLYYNVMAMFFLTPMMIYTWQPMPLQVWSLLLLMGVFFGVGQLAIVHAYSYSMPAKLAPFIFGEVFFTYGILHVVYGVNLSIRDALGGLLIIGSAIVMLWAQQRVKRVSAE